MSSFSFCSGSLELGKKTYIMGIVNVTPDSFSDGGKYFSSVDAVAHAMRLIEEGADMIDLGACSTRPGAEPVSSETETERLIPVIRELRKKTTLPISVDTFYPETAEVMLSLGADIINDVGGVFNENTAYLIKKYGAGYIAMHGGVKSLPDENAYLPGVVNAVQFFFDEISDKLENYGISPEFICLDPGFGFMKNTEQNACLLRNLSMLDTDKKALLVGLSRKRFIGELSEDENASERLGGTLAANILAAENGANIIRTHEVLCHRKAFNLLDSLAGY